MTPALDKKITFREQMAELQSRLRSLDFRIVGAERFLSARPGYGPTISRYNLLCHSRSEVLTKIRKLKERMGSDGLPA